MNMVSELMRKLLEQCRKPTGWLGDWVAWEMNLGHSKLTAWGLQHTSIEEHFIVLDVGCGGGRTVRELAKIATEGKVYGVDFSERSVAVSRRTNKRLIQAGHVEIRHSSVSSLPFSDDMFDLATAIETYYFWPDVVSDMQEILRVLKPGGKLMIIGEAYKGGKYDDRNQKWGELGDMIYHSVDELGALFSAAGYVDVQVFEEYDKGWICGMGRREAK